MILIKLYYLIMIEKTIILAIILNYIIGSNFGNFCIGN